jgi:hypothetical protein
MRLLGNHLFTMVIREKLTNNNAGQGRGWHTSAKDRKTFDKKIAESMIVTYDDEGTMAYAPFAESLAGTQLSDLVALTVTRVLGPKERYWDADSILRGNSKQMLDAIVGTRLLADDNPKYVSLVIGYQDKDRREVGPCIEVGFYETLDGSAVDNVSPVE